MLRPIKPEWLRPGSFRLPVADQTFYQLQTPTVLLLMLAFYGGTFLMSTRIARKSENVDGYMTSNGAVGFGISAASMTATWIWAASFYAAATSGYKYGISGPIHYGLWGALMILFIYPFGRRFREVAPEAHTLAEIMHARHGRSSQLILAGSNIAGSVISLMANFTAAGALVAMLSPLDFVHGVMIAGIGTLSYTLWSGFRASIMTDVVQVAAMLGAAALIIPLVFFNAGGMEAVSQGWERLSAEQASMFSKTAFLEQGAPYFVAVLAYAIGNQTIAQRLFAVREDLIKPTFISATISYGATVIGLGMLGVVALMVGIEPAGGDHNNLIPQMASSYLGPVMIGVFFIMVIGSLSSTADSDLAALSSIMMTDIYGKNLAKGRVNPATMLWVGRITMIVATTAGLIFASFRIDILALLVFVGALWGSIVFPVIASFYWKKVNNRAFTTAVLVSLVAFTVARFELLPIVGVYAVVLELFGTIGIGVVLGLMTFGFFGKRAGLTVGALAIIAMAPFTLGFLRDYPVLLSSLNAYGVSTVVCSLLSFRSDEDFDFDLIARRVRNFDDCAQAEPADDAGPLPVLAREATP
ncbi:sodium:solute symporter family protein [Luteimonas sp. A649]